MLGDRSHGQIGFLSDAALDQLVRDWLGPPEPEINEKECCDLLVMSAMDVGRERGGRLVIQVLLRLGLASLGPANPNRLLCLHQYLCGLVERTQTLESASSDFQFCLSSTHWWFLTNTTFDI